MRYLMLFLCLALVACKSTKQSTGNEPKKENKRKILTGVLITGIRIASFPKYGKDGEEWDAYAPFATDPDLFVTIEWNGNTLYKSEVRNECVIGSPVVFESNFPIIIKPFDQPLQLEIFDEDGISSNDNVGYFTLVLTEHKGQKEITLTSENVSVIMSTEWVYQ